MQITKNGLIFRDYQWASPGVGVSSFTDRDGATLLIDTDTLVRMYELCKLDLERRGGWAAVMARVETPQCGCMAENRAELLAEDIECLHMALDKAGVPRTEGEDGPTFSLWGRVLRFKAMPANAKVS